MVINKKICHLCKNLSYIYKCIEGKKYCKACAYKTLPNTKKTINKISVKKQKQDGEYSKLRKLYLESHLFCEAKLPGICTLEATDIHHKAGRIGENYLKVSEWLAVCRSCHKFIEENPIIAKELNFSKNRLNKL